MYQDIRKFLHITLILFVGKVSDATQENFFSFKLKDIRGNDVDLETFKGKVTLVVNTASQCSFTESHMKSLKRLHDILSYGNKFNVMVFPSNDFGEQEPWDEPEIEEYMRGHFKAEFPIMAKSNVIGQNAIDLWKWIAKTSVPPKWNFDKYLINQDGNIVNHWPGEQTVESIFNVIQALVDGTPELKVDQNLRTGSGSSSDSQERKGDEQDGDESEEDDSETKENTSKDEL